MPKNVKYIDGDISYKTSIDKAVKGATELYDCAGVLGTHELVFQTERAIDTNIKGAFNVIQSCIDNNVKEFSTQQNHTLKLIGKIPTLYQKLLQKIFVECLGKFIKWILQYLDG